MVESTTVLHRRACAKASRMTAIVALTSVKSGCGSNTGGRRINAPSVPPSPRASWPASAKSATATSHPRALQGAPLAASRTTARTPHPAASSVLATTPPTFPVIAVMANMVEPLLLLLGFRYDHTSPTSSADMSHQSGL